MPGCVRTGLKRHAVTLFEGGRVAGDATVAELTAELWASWAEGQSFEGDMARLAQVRAGQSSRHLNEYRLSENVCILYPQTSLVNCVSWGGLGAQTRADTYAIIACFEIPHLLFSF